MSKIRKIASITFLCLSAPSRIVRYLGVRYSVTGFLFSLMCFSVRKTDARTGLRVRLRMSEPNRAAATANAVGRNMAPSMP